ncbi:DUF6508 domain-containing protein [Pallidibacillus thermolactis]|jgi:Family of unknown function (DUF6508)|uniref:DUF6508 domain-containing protein n=1 Tax=Pallidibacillus thermolactis TaxID=251051 RepID=UPI002E235D02|nr:DUF6508 domain-containing protein [Pallidibacillus thermolactis subsp. kokeshiiformis]
MLSKAQIQTFIDYFSNEQNEFFKWNKPGESRSGVVQLGFIQYDDGVQQFINDLYEADMLDPHILIISKNINQKLMHRLI